MEYKLSKFEFYKVAYLLSGLFMFLFLFGILSLSSFASSGTFHGWYAQENVQNESYISFLNNFNPNDYNGMVEPGFDYSYSFTITKSIISGQSTSNLTVNFNVHVVTDEGDKIIGTIMFPMQTSSPLTQTFSYSGSCFGVPSYSYLEVIASSEWARIAGNFSFDSWSLNVTPRDFGSVGDYVADYSSFNYVTLSQDAFISSTYWGINRLNAGQIYNLHFPKYNQSTLYSIYPFFYQSEYSNSFMYKIRYKGTPLTAFSCSFVQQNLRDLSQSKTTIYTLSDLKYVETAQGYHTYLLFIDVPNGFNATSNDVLYITSASNSGGNFQDVTFSMMQRSLTISDYMTQVQDQWSSITPNVTTTNTNIARSVSDIGDAQTFETSAFTDFDSSMSTSGLDTFSLSFSSTPLLWCASIINTFYNNMPSGFQYLLMFVAFVGILVIVLNIAGRVVRRFGGD